MASRHISYNVTPISLFELYFDDDVIEYLCQMTELYAHEEKGDHLFSITVGNTIAVWLFESSKMVHDVGSGY